MQECKFKKNTSMSFVCLLFLFINYCAGRICLFSSISYLKCVIEKKCVIKPSNNLTVQAVVLIRATVFVLSEAEELLPFRVDDISPLLLKRGIIWIGLLKTAKKKDTQVLLCCLWVAHHTQTPLSLQVLCDSEKGVRDRESSTGI